LELSQVRYFVALCSERNFTRAAKQCRVSQPSLSSGIKALERELGGELFVRASMVLTPLGKRVGAALGNCIRKCHASPEGCRRLSAASQCAPCGRRASARILSRFRVEAPKRACEVKIRWLEASFGKSDPNS
jgi:DNA-binding transcriptional LysR family regulator